MKTKVFNFGGLFWVVALAFGTSMIISLDSASASGNSISWLELLRASLSGLIAMCGFFTRREINADGTEEK